MRKNKAAFLWMDLAIVTAIVFISHAVAEETKEITCTGKVVDAQKQALEGAKVALYVYTRQINSFSYGVSPTEQVTAGSDGGFSLSVPADSGNYINGYVVAQREGFAMGWSKWDMRKGSVELEIELSKPNALAGVVVDENDKPVPAARVSISYLHINKQYLPRPFAPTLLSTETDADGKFTFTNLPLGTTADFTVEKTGFATIGTTSSQLRHTVEQRDIKFVLPVEARIEGVVVEKKTSKPAAGVRLIVKEQNRWVQDAFNSKDDGTFSVNSLTPGKYKLELLPPRAELADWIAEPVEVMAETGKTSTGVRIELVKGGVLEVVVTDAVSGKPVENAGVTILHKLGSQSGYGLSGKDGIIRIRLMPGEYFLLDGVYKQGYSLKSGEEPFAIADGKTERWEYALFPESKITGVVRDEKGTPLEGSKLMVWPAERQQEVVANAGGKFEVVYDKQNLSSDEIPALLLCRYEKGNLAATLEINEDTRVLDVKLKSGVIFTGKVADPDGKGIEGAKLCVNLCKPGLSWPIVPVNPTRNEATTDKEGKFEIKAVPTGHKYSLSIEAKGYGNKRTEQIDTNDAVDNQLDLGNIMLAVANLSVSGVVVDDNDKPVAGAVVSGRGNNQPYRMTKSDVNGKFTLEGVCAGKIRIGAVKFGATTMLGSVDTEVEATDIKIVISEKSSHPRYVPKQPASLVGKPLPELKDLQIELSPADLDNKRILVCFWDMNQRPSRNCILELAGRAKELKDKGVIIAAVQASAVDEKALAEWINEHKISFPVEMIPGDVEKTKLTWNVRSLPWVILTDREHIVRAEGFAFSELDNKLKQSKGD